MLLPFKAVNQTKILVLTWGIHVAIKANLSFHDNINYEIKHSKVQKLLMARIFADIHKIHLKFKCCL